MNDGEGQWRDRFPALAQDHDPVMEALLGAARTVKVRAGEFVFHVGARCDSYLLSLEGTIRVQLTAENGREVTLYRVGPGGSCILTTSCLIGGERYPAQAIAETEVTALAIDQAGFNRTLDGSARFRRFVFADLSSRLAEVIRRMESITFTTIDKRLAGALLQARSAGTLAGITHQALAVELGTAREVVSRHLKRFESDGLITLGRGRIDVVDAQGLARLGAAGPV